MADTLESSRGGVESTRPRTAQVAVGVFVCWQLWFLVSQNIFGAMEDAQGYIKPPLSETIERVAPGFTKDEGRGHVYEVSRWVMGVNKPWMQISGQLQSWALFSGSYNDCSFPAVVLRWDDEDPLDYFLGPDVIDHPLESLVLARDRPFLKPLQAPEAIFFRSPHEPADMTSYFRWRQMRMRRFENAIALILSPTDCKDAAEVASYFAERIRKHTRDKGYMITAYLKMRLRELEPEIAHLGPPRQVILVTRRYRTAEPEEGPPWQTGPFAMPLVVWHPPGPGEKGEGTYKRYDPETNTMRSW